MGDILDQTSKMSKFSPCACSEGKIVPRGEFSKYRHYTHSGLMQISQVVFKMLSKRTQ